MIAQGAFTPLWDRLFGTAWMPREGEWPDTGIAELDQPRTVGDWLSLPFRFRNTDKVDSKSVASHI
ncbi:hypothetical protein [Sphingomonas spermidinifaciens]|uniref:hypothetical protein n=1 Tax=Sphingomonas spermidinifaciens TaxID=1141889 RepID=UPI001143E817|nr:hypothetical protein [Sphingomonas spermidinifaciens]